MKKRLSKRGKKILATAVAFVLIFGLLPNTALFEGWSVQAWAGTETLSDANASTYFEITTNLTYTGNELSAVSPTTAYSTLSEDTDYTVAYYKEESAGSGTYSTISSDLKDVGTYQIGITPIAGDTFTGGSEVTLTQTVTVAQLDLSQATIQVTGNTTYTGSNLTPSITVMTGNGTVNSDVYDVTYDTNNITAGADAGSGTVSVNSAHTENVTGSKNFTFTISEKSIDDTSIKVTINPENYVLYQSIPTVTVVDTGRSNTTLQENTDYTYKYYATEDDITNDDPITATDAFDFTTAQDYYLVVTGTGNYSGTNKQTYAAAMSAAPTVALSTTNKATFTDTTNQIIYYSNGGTSETVTLTFTEEHYALNLDGSQSPVKPTVTISTDGTSFTEIDSSNINWGDWQTDGTITATITLPYESDQSVSYWLKPEYTDISKNALTVASGSESTLQTDGVTGAVTSWQIVLDDETPTVEVAYVTWDVDQYVTATPSTYTAVGDSYTYYNSDIYLQLTITDSNISFANAKAYLQKLILTDISGSDITSTSAITTTLSSLSETDAVIENGTMTLRILLSENAYYSIASAAISDLAGNESGAVDAQYVCVDTVQPAESAGIYVSYHSDVVTTATDIALFTGSGNIGGTAVEILFGRTYVSVDLYLPDNLSGVTSFQYSYGGSNDTKTSTGQPAYYDINGAAGYYTLYEDIQLPISTAGGNELQYADNLIISSITDKAGNVLSDGVNVTACTSVKKLIVDNVAPTVSANYQSAAEDSSTSTYYYAQTGSETWETVTLTYTEEYYQESGNTIGLTVYQNGDEVTVKPLTSATAPSAGDTLDDVSVLWGEYDSLTYTITATVYLPYDTDTTDGSEIEYVVKTSYMDGSENDLTVAESGSDALTAADTTADGWTVYATNTLVLDNKAPEITSFEISGVTDKMASDGVTVAYSNVSAGTVTLKWIIDDNESYWDADSIKFTIYNYT
ncbi:MAG: hypothetical protein LUD53_01630, partial [Clostridiales bacterium]|nr:hypothetical protein [Clostridiales bacterium]